MKYRRRILILTLLFSQWIACSGSQAPAQDPTVYTVQGVFARVEDGGGMTVRHEEILGYMASMTMSFKVEDPASLDALAYGDKIKFELLVDSHGTVARLIEKLPPETVLSFETSE